MGKIADLDGLAQLAIAESNQGFENSKVKIRFELAGTYVVKDYHESGSYNTDLYNARVKDDGYMDDLHTVRANTSANVVVKSHLDIALDRGSIVQRRIRLICSL